jgi:hypothetical protein
MTRFFRLLGILLFASALPSTGRAADIAPAPAVNDWTFVAAAYLWGAGINGRSGVFGLPPVDFDVNFSDLLEHLDFAFMGVAEARKGRFMLGTDLTYTKLSASVDTPRGIIVNKLDITTTEWMVTGVGGYALFDNDIVRLDAIAGGRLWSVESEFDLQGGLLGGRTSSDGATWVDPLVGAKMLVDVTPDIYATGWAMIGGFGVGSDLMWDLMAGAGYKFTDKFSVFAGYRAVSVDYSNDGFVFDVVQQGPVFAGVFQF